MKKLIEVKELVEKAILVGAPRKGSADARALEEHMDELARLVDTAGAEAVGRMSQQLASANAATLIGEGKIEELKALAIESEATLIIFDEELSPVQGANLEKQLGMRVMDRAEVILDIFSTRARSHEAQLQVQLAQLQYTLPRLRRMWTHLSRIRGGIGLRGPGETQLETDRRAIRTKISHLREKLRDVERHRDTMRTGRDPLLTVALVGYTNAGKSSLLRALCGEHDIFVEDRLFATLDTLTREVELGEGQRARVTDTVGFIRKLPHHLVASFRATLEEARAADVLLHVIDASHPEFEEQKIVVEQVLKDLGLGERMIIPVFNKMDMLPDQLGFAQRIRSQFPDALFATTMRTDGLASLRARLREQAALAKVTVVVQLSLADGARLAGLYRDGDVLGSRVVDEFNEVTVRLDKWQVEQLRAGGATVIEVPAEALRQLA